MARFIVTITDLKKETTDIHAVDYIIGAFAHELGHEVTAVGSLDYDHAESVFGHLIDLIDTTRRRHYEERLLKGLLTIYADDDDEDD